MEALPQDLVDQIVSYLLPEDFRPNGPYDKRQRPALPLTPLATLSRRLQASVERLTFKYIKINSDELAEFDQLLTPARRSLLAGLTFTVNLPSYDAAASLRAESPAERAANDDAYSQAIHRLFKTLKAWELEDSKTIACRMALAINNPESPSDRPWPSQTAPWGLTPGTEDECIHEGRYLHSYIDLLNLEDLPVLDRVKHLTMLNQEDKYGYRQLFPRVSILLAAKMPNLESVRINMDDSERRFPDMRKRNRDDAAHAIRTLSLPELKRADLHFFLRRYRDESISPPILHNPGIPDPLSSAICELSQNLVKLDITGVFDMSLLRPLQGLSETSWPRLRFFDVDFHATTPSGDWYFTSRFPQSPGSSTSETLPDPQYNHSNLHEEQFSFQREAEYASQSPTDSFRAIPKNDTLVPFIEAYADALSAMPKLVSALFHCQLEDRFDDGEPGWFSIAYFAACINANKHPPKLVCTNCNRSIDRQLVTSWDGWAPSEELAAKLRGIQDAFSKTPMVVKRIEQYLEENQDLLDD
ncbi:hypothetical protein G7Z17_g6734 [Cylindrodendrum hubeiense]|uniref:F-box domain-containing protein n=1 Tax=Cylindrodendrum hubeiense TaxID=595255 RepID=A0A9P5HBR4_9HYPO|nr:hypothetical protein G7Z17_g6734 [Cylindrodendrum hubeiense]